MSPEAVLAEGRFGANVLKRLSASTAESAISTWQGTLTTRHCAVRWPSRMPRCQHDSKFVEAFTNLTAEELMQERTHKLVRDAYVLYRFFLRDLALEHTKLGAVTTTLKDTRKLSDIIIVTRGLRTGPKGSPLLEVQYTCNTKESFTPASERALFVTTMQAHSLTGFDQFAAVDFHITMMEAMLIREILVANAARLDPEYIKQCRKKWHLEGTRLLKMRQMPDCLLLQQGMPEMSLAPAQATLQQQSLTC
ncbi:hypothetical protein WJX73_002777 [Symbiochloris irregularis]|uniref:Uncharacterized protein n=1 Tax=Symbiochloris irregularis TaxID=706552 RepID=A0AAW1NKT5_9CHLO